MQIRQDERVFEELEHAVGATLGADEGVGLQIDLHANTARSRMRDRQILSVPCRVLMK